MPVIPFTAFRSRSRRPFAVCLIALIVLFAAGELYGVGTRIKDVATLEGRRDNQLVGYGLVVGLAGDGDSNQAAYTVQSISSMLQRFGVNVDPAALRSDNVAAVMVTADIEAFARPGARMDVLVSAIGDADTLQGGTLLQTPLLGADDEVYAVAQGPLLIGGFAVDGGAGGGGAMVQRNHPTVGTIPGGAIVEREIPTPVVRDDRMNFLLRESDFASAVRVAEAVNNRFPGSARAESASTVAVLVPEEYRGHEAVFIASVEAIPIQPDVRARVVMNERTGTIVATSTVRLSEVAISHGGITITIARTPVISQPGPFSEGETVVDELIDLEVTEVDGGFRRIGEMPTLEELTNALNTLGVGSRDMISIFQSLQRAGALHAEIIMN